jgi:predicted SnoaL-like aldol condensation-catalyzing enzyme
MMYRRWLMSLSVLLVSYLALAADSAPLGFLQRKPLPYPQDRPLPMPQTPLEVRERNKQVVLDFYKIISDQRQWTEENRRKYFQDDFIQHDPAEPNTSEAFFNFFRAMMPPPAPPADASAGGASAGGASAGGASAGGASAGGATAAARPPGPMRMPGVTSADVNGSPVNWMVAEGDIVVVVRHRNWDWPGGPTPVYNGIFVDIWRLQDGKIKEQWCTATPADANLNRIFALMKQGKFPKNKDWD